MSTELDSSEHAVLLVRPENCFVDESWSDTRRAIILRQLEIADLSAAALSRLDDSLFPLLQLMSLTSEKLLVIIEAQPDFLEQAKLILSKQAQASLHALISMSPHKKYAAQIDLQDLKKLAELEQVSLIRAA